MRADMSLMRLTISKVLEKLIAMINVQCGRGTGLDEWLKPQAIACARRRRAETMEGLGRKPCLVAERGSETSSG